LETNPSKSMVVDRVQREHPPSAFPARPVNTGTRSKGQ
jgi:hypothetical protein